jgi:hypothetical protein
MKLSIGSIAVLVAGTTAAVSATRQQTPLFGDAGKLASADDEFTIFKHTLHPNHQLR